MSAHASQVFSKAHCTNSEDLSCIIIINDITNTNNTLNTNDTVLHIYLKSIASSNSSTNMTHKIKIPVSQ